MIRYSEQIDYLDMRRGYDEWDKLSKKDKVVHALKNSHKYKDFLKAQEIAEQEISDAVDWLQWEDYESKNPKIIV